MKQGDSKKAGEVLTTGGEASAAGYVAAEVPAGKDCPTIDVARVRIVPPSQTPTVKLGDVVKGAGPRAPEQMVKPTPKGLVELPERRPVTKMQRIEVDPEFLRGLEQGLVEGDEGAAETGGEVAAEAQAGAETSGVRAESPWVKEAGAAAVAAAELPSAEGPPAEVVSEPVKRPRRSGMVMAVAIGVTVVVGVIAAMMPRRGPEPGTRGSATAVPSATVVPNATATVSSATPPPSVAAVAVPIATASAAPALSARASVPAPTVRPRATAAENDPYDDAPVPAPAVAPVPEKTVTSKPPAAPTAGKIPEF